MPGYKMLKAAAAGLSRDYDLRPLPRRTGTAPTRSPDRLPSPLRAYEGF
eukprot:CAMPEP_0181198314 /NCGR_PEP_ID=MMETSP1096-20121128/16546_1 /TAXON_ID=156174 ORGANISM="Chrysochromulina ericina, Strain CCMP281" /NCGR_SAMPLE_ID=MMETSP1096 /ASSEMBLY_ACC=CAM_ASM_000453 /LENGTH=48 /DNA_ID= /DNA_START= /DNA_END= /DNA_ORIENTATION=